MAHGSLASPAPRISRVARLRHLLAGGVPQAAQREAREVGRGLHYRGRCLQAPSGAHREQLAEELARRIERASGLQEQLACFFEICLSRVDQNREFFLAIAFPLPLDEASASEGPGGTEFALVIKNFNDAVDRILDEGFQRGELGHRVSPSDRNCLGTLIVGAMGARGRLEAPPPVAESAASFARFALRGLGHAPR